MLSKGDFRMTTIQELPRVVSPIRRYNGFGKLGLAASFLPLLIYGLMIVIKPG
jgi:hypothetical protein